MTQLSNPSSHHPSSHHHIIPSSHHHIITSSHHHIITLSHHPIIPHQFPPRFKANEFRQLCSLKNIKDIKKIFACKKNQNSQLTINNFPPFRVGEKKIVYVKVALSIGAVVLHKTQCLSFLIRDLHHITTSSHYPIITSSHHHIITSSRNIFHPASWRMNFANFAPLNT